jgi:hypothetical protein
MNMRVMGKALPNGGARYITVGGVFDIVRADVVGNQGWALCCNGQQVLRHHGAGGRKQCVRYLQHWLHSEYWFAL